MPGMHVLSGWRHAGQLMFVHSDNLLTPLPGHLQVLQPSPAAKVTKGQHWSSGIGAGTGGQASWVQVASLQRDESGQVQLL